MLIVRKKDNELEKELEKLKAACFKLAQTTHWDMKPVDVDLIQDFSNKLYDEALEQYELVKGLGASIPLVTRAIFYIEQAHAIPPIKDDIQWFSQSLRVLLEVSCPNAGLDGEAKEYLLDMIKGISSFIID